MRSDSSVEPHRPLLMMMDLSTTVPFGATSNRERSVMKPRQDVIDHLLPPVDQHPVLAARKYDDTGLRQQPGGLSGEFTNRGAAAIEAEHRARHGGEGCRFGQPTGRQFVADA